MLGGLIGIICLIALYILYKVGKFIYKHQSKKTNKLNFNTRNDSLKSKFEQFETKELKQMLFDHYMSDSLCTPAELQEKRVIKEIIKSRSLKIAD
jgi:hypothetical protein